MKRTQTKAVKPARKGAVKVPIPRGWRKLKLLEPICTRDRYLVGKKTWKQTSYYTSDGLVHDIKRMTYIRRNPRAARANKGRNL